MTIYTNLDISKPVGRSADRQFVIMALRRLVDDGYMVKYKKLSPDVYGALIWSGKNAIYYTHDDSPDRYNRHEFAEKNRPVKIRGATDIAREQAGVETVIQAIPNGCGNAPTYGADFRTFEAPYPPARSAFLCELGDAKPVVFTNKSLDIFTSWNPLGYLQYRFDITKRFMECNWEGLEVLMTIRKADAEVPEGWPAIKEYHKVKAVHDRLHWIHGPAHRPDIYKAYMTDELAEAKVSWDSVGWHSAPYTHRFIECAWGGVCVIRNGPVGGYYEPGVDYIVEPDAGKAFSLAIELVKTGKWKPYAQNLAATYRKYNTVNAFSRYLLCLVTLGPQCMIEDRDFLRSKWVLRQCQVNTV